MRHYDTSCGPMSCVPTRKFGSGLDVHQLAREKIERTIINTRICHQTPILSCSGVAISFVKLQVWSFHKWYRYTTARQYRSLITNSGTPSFLVGTQDIGPHEVS